MLHVCRARGDCRGGLGQGRLPERSGAGEVLAGPEGGGGAVADADLAEDVADVDLDGALADAEPAGDLLVGQARGREPQDLLLPLAEQVGGGRLTPREQGP